MAKSKLHVLLAAGLCCSMLLTGCSAQEAVSDVVDKVGGADTEEVTEDSDTDTTETKEDDGKEVDASLAAPEFTAQPSGSVNVLFGVPFSLKAQATSSDGGTISYQWYKNNVNSNGGGTQMDNATSEEFSVETTEEGTAYYYVVATSTVGNGISKATSSTECIKVLKEGSWQDDGTGAYHYMYTDNSGYLSNCLCYDGIGYLYVDENGLRVVSAWTADGHYMDENGYMMTSGWTPDNYYVDENGNKLADCWTPDDHYVNGDGQMWTSGTTPDGVYVDENGNRADPPA